MKYFCYDENLDLFLEPFPEEKSHILQGRLYFLKHLYNKQKSNINPDQTIKALNYALGLLWEFPEVEFVIENSLLVVKFIVEDMGDNKEQMPKVKEILALALPINFELH